MGNDPWLRSAPSADQPSAVHRLTTAHDVQPPQSPQPSSLPRVVIAWFGAYTHCVVCASCWHTAYNCGQHHSMFDCRGAGKRARFMVSRTRVCESTVSFDACEGDLCI